MEARELRRALDGIWRIESARLVAGLTRVVGDLGLAEDLAQDALVAALEHWPRTGIPKDPGAWLRATARNRAIDLVRRRERSEQHHRQLAAELEEGSERNLRGVEEALDDPVGDDLLGLLFMACHPSLSSEARLALTLRILCGLSTAEIARAFLVPETTVAQRIVRAKRVLAEEQVPFEVPRGAELASRLGDVLGVLYLLFNEGYSATAGEDWVRPALCEEAQRLGRILAELVPDEPEVHGLVALMELQASRLRARIGPGGAPVLLLDQDRGRWDRLLIDRGLKALARSEAALAARGSLPGPYGLQARIAACHARAATAPDTDWARIAALYAVLARVAPSPIVELNRAVAIGMAEGPAAGLERLEPLRAEPVLAAYHLLPGVRADFLIKLGRLDEARVELERAATLTRNARERALLLERAAACAGGARD